ncbi:hypothetical protein JBE04_13020 [Streptomyces sp. PRKS01-29]|nr:ATP-binding protein [Streptomyces sabulosicollis]MBI0295357.1 hypothetical protein [Streptomyces sabulosicollis]
MRSHLGIARELLRTWPGRFRYPEVLGLLVRQRDDYAPEDAVALGRAVLAHLGGRPARVVCEELLERGEFDSAEYLLAGCEGLRAHEAERLTRQLEGLRVKATEFVRQRVATLRRRAAAAGVTWEVDATETDLLVEQARSGRPLVVARLDELAGELERVIAEAARELEDRLLRTEADAGPRRADGAVRRIRTLIEAGELVAAAALLNREPPGAAIPEGTTGPPAWKEEWDPRTFLEYHLNSGRRRPPEFFEWRAADPSGQQVLETYGRLDHDRSTEAVEGFARALSRFLGASAGPVVATPIENSPFHLAFLDGLFADPALTRLHPTGRVDLYVGGPDAVGLPEEREEQAPYVVVGPGVEAPGYTDRRAAAVLSLRDLLRLVVLDHEQDRAAAALGILAPQWPVTALTGNSGTDLARVLGDDPDGAWRTLRWISHLSLRCGPTAVQAMENCTGMDPHLLLVMLRYAENPMASGSPVERWAAAEGGWQRDEALTHALREELTARCAGPVAEAAWWAALAASDAATGHVSREDAADMAEACAAPPRVRAEIPGGVDALVRHGLLVWAAPAADGTLRVPLNGITRTLRPEAEQQLTALLERLAHVQEEERDSSSAWHLNRFATVPAYARWRAAGEEGVDPPGRAELAAEAERQLREQDIEESGGAWERPDTEPAAVLESLAAEFAHTHPKTRLDLRCPPGLRVGMPEPVLRAVLYEVMDNAAEAMAGRDGVIQVLVKLDSPEVLVEVRDSGPGLPEKVGGRPGRVFGRTWTTRGDGRGEGLHRVVRFLRAHATESVYADIEVIESDNPALTGAAFRLVLPEHTG